MFFHIFWFALIKIIHWFDFTFCVFCLTYRHRLFLQFLGHYMHLFFFRFFYLRNCSSFCMSIRLGELIWGFVLRYFCFFALSFLNFLYWKIKFVSFDKKKLTLNSYWVSFISIRLFSKGSSTAKDDGPPLYFWMPAPNELARFLVPDNPRGSIKVQK